MWRSDRPLHGNSSIKPYLRRPQRPSTFQPTPLPLPIAIVMAFNGRRANVLPFSRELIGCHWRSAKATRSLFSSFLFFLIKKKFISKSGAHSSKDESETQYSMVENPSKSRWVPSGKPFSLISKRSEIESTKKTGLPLQFNR